MSERRYCSKSKYMEIKRKLQGKKPSIPITEEPITEEPITEEPITEEPITEEPITEGGTNH